MIKCCRNCVAPKRHVGCHGTCKEYLEEKAAWEDAKKSSRKDNIYLVYKGEKRGH